MTFRITLIKTRPSSDIAWMPNENDIVGSWGENWNIIDESIGRLSKTLSPDGLTETTIWEFDNLDDFVNLTSWYSTDEADYWANNTGAYSQRMGITYTRAHVDTTTNQPIPEATMRAKAAELGRVYVTMP